MAIIPFMNVGAKGVNFDVPDVLLPNTQFSDCLNVRFKNGAVEKVGGYDSIYDTNNNITFSQYWNRPTTQYYILGTGANVRRVDSAQNSTDIGTGFASDSVWNAISYNGGYTSIWNNGQTTPHYITYRTGGESDGVELTPLPGWNYGGIEVEILNTTGSDGKTFTLSESPNNVAVTVTVGGDDEPSANYTITNDELVFDDDHLPAAGAPIEVKYTSTVELHNSTADGSTYDFALDVNPTYPISVYVDDVLQVGGFSILSTGAIRFITPPANNAVVIVERTPNYVSQGSFTYRDDAVFGLRSIAYVHSNTELTLTVVNPLHFATGNTYTVTMTDGDTTDDWVFTGENIEVDEDDRRIWKISTFTTNEFTADVSVANDDADLTNFNKYSATYDTTKYQILDTDNVDNIDVFLDEERLASSEFSLSSANSEGQRFITISATQEDGDGIAIVVDNGVVIGSFFGGETDTEFTLADLQTNQATRAEADLTVFLDDSEVTSGFTFGGTPITTIDFTTAPANGVNVRVVDQVEQDTTVTAEVIAAFEEVIVAGNLTEDDGSIVVNKPGTVRVSTRAAAGALPTTWEPGALSDTSTADEFEIADTDPIKAMLPLRGRLVIYTERGIYGMQIGRDSTFVRPLNEGYGAVSQKAVVEVEGKHVFFDRNDVLIHSGTGEVKSVLNHIGRDFLFKERLNYDAIENVVLQVNPKDYEIYICYPTGTNTSCDEALIWNYRDNTLSRIEIPNVRAGMLAPVFDGTDFTADNQHLVLASDSNSKLYHMNEGQTQDGTSFTAYVERRNLQIGDVEKEKWTGSVYPLVSSDADDVMMTVHTLGTDVVSDMDSIITDDNSESIEYNIDDEYKVDSRSQGRFFNIRFETTADDDWQLSGYMLSTVESSAR